jgi:carboxyl-terminal processing protease
VVFGGGGVMPDVIVKPDTITTPEQDFIRAIATKQAVIYNTMFSYARELRPSLKPDFKVEPAWRDELYRRLTKADVKVDRKVYDAAEPYINRSLEQQLARLAFGDSAAFRRSIHEDRQLLTAIEYITKARSQRDMLALAAKESNNQ